MVMFRGWRETDQQKILIVAFGGMFSALKACQHLYMVVEHGDGQEGSAAFGALSMLC